MQTDAVTSTRPRSRRGTTSTRKAPVVYFFISVDPAENLPGKDFWSSGQFRDKYGVALDQIGKDDWLFVDFSKQDGQLEDHGALANLQHMVFDTCKDRKARIGLIVNDRDRASLCDIKMNGFFTLFFSIDELRLYFPRTKFRNL